MLKISGLVRVAVVGMLSATSFVSVPTWAQGGWEQGSNGSYMGTGSNAGGGWERTSNGYAGTGNNAGAGWANTGNGAAGTGSNAGGG